MKELKTKSEFEEFLTSAGDKAVAIDFTATWCGPCRMIGPKFEAMSSEFKTIEFAKIDVDANSEVAEQQQVSAMPTFMIFKNKAKVDELVGASEEKLRAMLNRHV